MFGNKLVQKRERICRFITHAPGGYGTGTGFFINNQGTFLTCFHVAFGKDLRQIRVVPEFQRIGGSDDHSKLEKFLGSLATKWEVEIPDGSRYDAKLQRFNETHDIALFKVSVAPSQIKSCKVSWDASLNYGDRVCFGGFPTHHSYPPDKAPFAVHEGIISSFVKTVVGGDEYEHLQINSINLGGNSGAPLFRGRSDTVVGIVNGNMNFGNDNVVFREAGNNLRSGPLRIPLSIAYATPMRLLKDFVLSN